MSRFRMLILFWRIARVIVLRRRGVVIVVDTNGWQDYARDATAAGMLEWLEDYNQHLRRSGPGAKT